MVWKPHTTVAAVIERQGRFLMVEEESGGNIVYNQPAGHLDEGESLIEAVCRETLEETACHITPTAITGIYLWRNTHNERTFLRICFTGTCRGHDPGRPLDDGIIRSLWMTRDELEQDVQRLRNPMVLRCIDDYLSDIRYPLSLLTHLKNPRI